MIEVPLEGPSAFSNFDEDGDGQDNLSEILNGTDPEDPQSCFGFIFYEDKDKDGFGSELTRVSCFLPEGFSDLSGDCNDEDASVYPGADEVCDGKDQDCDGEVDEGLPQFVWYIDGDGDGYGGGSFITTCQAEAPSGFTSVSGDCDDNSFDVNPSAKEICDGIDNDCNGVVDGLVEVCYDGPNGTEGVGECKAGESVCNNGVWSKCLGQVLPQNEICDGLDNDCDNQVDEGVLINCYRDEDGDGFGDPNIVVQACLCPQGYVGNAGDCDDTNPQEKGLKVFWKDADGDGFGNPEDTKSACQTPPGYVSTETYIESVTNFRIIVEDSPTLDLTQSFTLEIKFKPTINKYSMLTNKEIAYEIAMSPDGHIKWALRTAGTWKWHDTGVYADFGKWNHIHLVYDGKYVYLYKNGVLGSKIEDPDGGPISQTDYPLRIGIREAIAGSQSIVGLIDSVRIYSRVLTEDEVKRNVEGDIARDGLVLEFEFSKMGGNFVFDESGNENHGRFLGSF